MCAVNPITEAQIQASIAQGEASFSAKLADGVLPSDITPEIIRDILRDNMDRLTAQEPEKACAVDLDQLFA